MTSNNLPEGQMLAISNPRPGTHFVDHVSKSPRVILKKKDWLKKNLTNKNVKINCKPWHSFRNFKMSIQFNQHFQPTFSKLTHNLDFVIGGCCQGCSPSCPTFYERNLRRHRSFQSGTSSQGLLRANKIISTSNANIRIIRDRRWWDFTGRS